MDIPLIQSVGVVVFNGNNILLVEHGKEATHLTGVYGLPSGKIEPGEEAIDAAVRELREETGLVTTSSDLIPLPKVYRATIEQKDGVKVFDWHVFVCKKYSGNLRETDETKPFWISVDELITLTLLPNVQEAITESRNL
ncbi:MAG: NUDIX hydrolase [bacterium]|nr:NUDIX hydrolase [bacterium]